MESTSIAGKVICATQLDLKRLAVPYEMADTLGSGIMRQFPARFR